MFSFRLRPRRVALALFLLALVLRVAALLVRGEFRPPTDVGAEAGAMARYLVEGRGFASPFDGGHSPSTHLPPVYPLLLAGLVEVQRLVGPGSTVPGPLVFYAALALNLIASSLLPVAGKRLADEAGFPRAVGGLGGLALCVCPEAFRAVGLIWDEAVFVTLGAFLLAWLVGRLRAGEISLRTGAFLGILNGLLSLLNPALLVALPAGWIAALAVRRVPWRRVALHALLLAGLTLLAGLPWHLRNWAGLREPVLVRGNYWLEVWSSLHPVARVRGPDGQVKPVPVHPWNGSESLVVEGHPITEQAYFAWCRQRALAVIRAHPQAYWLGHVAAQFDAFWLGPAEARRWGRSPVVFFLAQGVPALLGLAGLLMLRRRMDPAMLNAWCAILIVFPLPYYFAGGGARYRHPIDVLLYLGIGYLAWRVLEKRRA